MNPSKLLVDADILLFTASVSVEVVADWGDDVWTLMSDAKDGLVVLEELIAELEEATGIAHQDFVFCLSDTENFRFDVSDVYKSNRKGNRKPLCYRSLKDYLVDNHHCEWFPKLEGDDVIGILSEDEDCAIWSRDKDLKQIAGVHWEEDDWEEVDDDDADFFFLYQCLVGDPSDGYKGCPGIGAVKADRLLSKEPTWETVVAAYEKAGLSEDDAITTARMARILRPGEYDFENEEPILWQP